MISTHILGWTTSATCFCRSAACFFRPCHLPLSWCCPDSRCCKCFLVPPDLTKSGFAAILNQLELTWRPSLATTSANRNDYKGYSLMSLRLAASWKFLGPCWSDIPRVTIWSVGEHIHLTLVLLRNKDLLFYFQSNQKAFTLYCFFFFSSSNKQHSRIIAFIFLYHSLHRGLIYEFSLE